MSDNESTTTPDEPSAKESTDSETNSIFDSIPDPNPEQKLIISLDSRVLSKIQTCNQQAAYRFIDNIEPVEYDGESFALGLVMHEGLAEHYEHKHRLPYNLVKVQAMSRMESYAVAKTSLSRPQINSLIDIYNQYTKKYEDESWIVLKDSNGNPVVEKTFAKKLFENEYLIILYTGVTDLVVNPQPGVITPADHKTFGSYYKAAVNSNQFKGYMWALNSKSLIVNRIGVKSKAGTFERVAIHTYPELIEEWKRDAIEDVLNHLGQVNRKWFRRNREACTNYGGCPYLKLCMAEPNMRKYLIDAEYKRVPEWSPLNRD